MPGQNLLKGALSYINATDASQQRLVFQFNPETLVRTQLYSEQTNTIAESIRLTLILSAIDGLEQGLPEIIEDGIYPQLAAFEEMVVLQTKGRNSWLDWLFSTNRNGFLVLIYGERIIPVRIQRLKLNELQFNNLLKPIHAKLDLALRVLTEKDFRRQPNGLKILTAYQQYRNHKAKLTN